MLLERSLFFLNCVAANRQAHLRDQREKDGFMGDPLIGIDGDLKITTREPGKVEGEFLATNDDDRGVYFLSEVKEDSGFLLITTLEGEQLYRAVSPRNDDILVSLMGNDFLLKNYESAEGRTILQGRLVPAGSIAAIERTLDEPDGIEERLFSAEDEAYSLSAMQRSYKKLHRRKVQDRVFRPRHGEIRERQRSVGKRIPSSDELVRYGNATLQT